MSPPGPITAAIDTTFPEPAERGRTGRSAAILFGIAMCAWILTNMDQSLFSYMLPDIMRTFGFSLDDSGMIISLSFLAGMILAPIAGTMTDRWSLRGTMMLCLGGSATLVALQGIATTGPVFILLRALSFGLSAGLSPISNTMVAAAATDRTRTWVLTLLQCGYPIGWFAASLLTAAAFSGGWRTLFLIALAVVPVALLFGFVLPKRVEGRMSTTPAVARPLVLLFSHRYRRQAIAFGGAFLTYGLSAGALAFFLPTFFQTVRHYTPASAALIVGIAGVIGTAGYFLSALISQRWLSLRMTTVTWVWLGAVLFIGAIWLPTSVPADIAAFGLMGVFVYGTASIGTVYMVEFAPPEIRGTALGICGSACVNAGFLLSPLIATHLVALVGWQAMFTCFVGVSLALCGLCFWMAAPPNSAVD